MNIAIILIILLVGSVFTYFSGNRLASMFAIFFSIAAAVFGIALYINNGAVGTNFNIDWINNPTVSFSLKADGLSIAMILLTTVLLPIILLMSHQREYKNEKLLYSLVLFMAFAMAGAFLSSDALLYYIFWEMSLIPIYFIIVLWGSGEMKERRKAAMTFFLYTFGGSLFMLASIIYLYTKAGSFQLTDFYNVELSHTEQIWVFLGFFLAYAIKVPIFPFHTWQANVYRKAPAIGTMLLSALMSKMGLYSIIRWQIPVTPFASHELRTFVVILCIIGVIYGSFLALKQDDLKRFLAYASLTHVGFIAAGAYALTYDGLEGAIILILAHGFGIVALFYSVDIIENRTDTLLISKLGGIKNYAPNFAMAFFISILFSIGIPLSFNFIGEFGIMLGLYEVNIWYALLIGTSLFMGAYFMLTMYQRVMLGPPSNNSFRDLSLSEKGIYIILIAIILFFGIYVKPVINLLAPSIDEIMTYINR